MALIDLERAMLAVCFREQPESAARERELLGDDRAWLVYRELVRERLWREIRFALPRTSAAVPDALFARTFAWQLAHRPPRTRFFREVVSAFVESALPLWAAEPALPALCSDLARYELALWEVADLDATLDEPAGEFGFDRVPVVSPALQLLSLSHAVHLPDASEPVPTWLCVHRATDGDRARTWSLTQSTHALLSRLCRGDETVTESVRQLATARGARIDAAYVDALCETLAQFLEIGIVLGSR